MTHPKRKRNLEEFLKEADATLAFLNTVETVELVYDGIRVIATRNNLDEAIHKIATETPETRQRIGFAVDRYLHMVVKKIRKKKASQKEAEGFHADLLVREALKQVDKLH